MTRRRHLRAVATALPALEFELDGNPLARVPERTFHATFSRAERRFLYQRTSLWLWFRLVALDAADANFDGLELPLICATRGGRFGPKAKFTKIWARVGGLSPQKGERLSTAIFSGRLFTIRTRTVRIDHEQHPHGALAEYSVVDDILEIEVGGTR
jgi:hypothetical protein